MRDARPARAFLSDDSEQIFPASSIVSENMFFVKGKTISHPEFTNRSYIGSRRAVLWRYTEKIP